MKIVGNWYRIEICVSCHKQLSDTEKMYSYGCCPYCGHLGSPTICKTYPVIVREIKYKRWWEFWIKAPSIFEGKDEISKNWLK